MHNVSTETNPHSVKAGYAPPGLGVDRSIFLVCRVRATFSSVYSRPKTDTSQVGGCRGWVCVWSNAKCVYINTILIILLTRSRYLYDIHVGPYDENT